MTEGWIKSYRKMIEWEWFKTPGMFLLFHYLIYKANHKEKSWEGVTIKRGDLVTSRKTLSKETGITERSVRTALLRLQQTNEISVKTTNQFSVITILNYDKYQSQENVTDQRPTSDRPATDQRPTTNKKSKNDKNEKNKEYSSEFLEFWNQYPGNIKGSKREAFKSWNKNNRPPKDELLIILSSQIKGRDNLKNSGEFVPIWPHIATYLNQARWEEEFKINDNDTRSKNQRIVNEFLAGVEASRADR